MSENRENALEIYWILVDYLTEFVKSPYIQVTLSQYQFETCTLKSACEFKMHYSREYKMSEIDVMSIDKRNSRICIDFITKNQHQVLILLQKFILMKYFTHRTLSALLTFLMLP